METKTKETVNNKGKLTAITYYDNGGKRTRQIDLQKNTQRNKTSYLSWI